MNDKSGVELEIRKEEIKQATVAHAVERISRALETISEDWKVILTNPFGLGGYWQGLLVKEDPIAYIPIVLFLGLVGFIASMIYNKVEYGIQVVWIAAGLVIILIILRFWENNQKRKDKSRFRHPK